MLIKTKRETYSFYKYLSLVIPKEFEKNINPKFRPSIATIETNAKLIEKPIDIMDIKKYVSNVDTLTIGCTQNCNLNCIYCIYGGDYIYSRTHSTRKMKPETYIHAVDFFYELVNSPSRINRKAITIGFYGGEPLLEFDNLYRCAKYAQEKQAQCTRKLHLNLMITTNAVFLNNEIIEKLFDLDFIIDVSLDGPKEEHNKFRIKATGYGSFDDVIFNIGIIKEKFPEFYSKKVRFYVTLHPSHDVKKMENFFLSRDDLFNEKNVSLSWVGLRDLKPDLQKSLLKARRSQARQIENELDKSKWFYKKIIFTWLSYLFEIPTQNISNKTDFTGSCYPGAERIFIDVDGNIHICERINHHFPIGSVYSGFDYKKMKEIIDMWNNEIVKNKCWDCDAWWLCNYCLASRALSDRFDLDKNECNNFIKISKKACAEFLTILEAEDDEKNTDCYRNIFSYLDSL